MRRGDIYFADLDPVKGSEANKRRPVIVVSHDALNKVVKQRRRGVVTVVPLTSNVTRILSFQVLLPADITSLPKDAKAQAEQVRALAYERFYEPVGALPPGYLEQLNLALQLHLALD